MKKLLKSVLAALMVCSLVNVMPQSKVEVKAESKGTTYYVSSNDGSDDNNGTSIDKPFKTLNKINELTLGPSDQVLLEAGSVFNDQYLHIKGSGAANEPIIITRYGEGADPIINTNGEGIWYQDYGKSLDNANHKYKGDVSSSILLYDVEHIEISELEITNSGADPNGLAYNDVNVMNRTGIAAVAQNAGTLDHIVIKDCNIHDVIGNVYDKHMNNGGIYFTAFKPDSELLTGIARYNDIVIENNIVDYCNRWGIAVGYTAYYDKFHGALIDDEKCATYGHTNVVIRNNYVNEPGGDAITMMYCFEPIVEYNVGEGTARQINPTDYSQTGFGRVAAGIWPWKCKTPLFQYNECYDSYENQDGQAWDADYGDGCIYQYNYSHNNGGGCVMICGGEAINTIFRYNISYLDGNDILDLAGNPNGTFYNNTFIVKEGVNVLGFKGGINNKIYNNIFYYTGNSAKSEDWFAGNTQADYERNIYYNYATLPDNDDTSISGDPKFVNLASAPTAYSKVNPSDGVITYGNNSGKFDGFKVADDSIAINAGMYIEDNGGLDFFGNKVSGTPDIGAYESKVANFDLYSSVYTISESAYVKEIENVPSGISKEQFLKNLDYNEALEVTFLTNEDTIDVNQSVIFTLGGTSVSYFIKLRAASSANSIETSDFAFDDDTIYVPIVNTKSITVEDLMNAITVSENASIKCSAANSEVVSEDLKVVVVAENGNEKTYNVVAKNTYAYLEDYEVNTQGPIWYAQVKSGSIYSNLTTYDATYPQFNGESYAGIGVDAPSHAAIKEAQHGLMIDSVDTNKRSGGHAIAFKASVDGKVSISLKDGEPYLRQAANQANSGTVVLKFTKNGELIDDVYPFPNDGSVITVLKDYAKEIVVSKGDYVRVEIQNVDGACLKASAHVSPIITYTSVEKIVDKSELQALYDANKDEKEKDYTPESYYIYSMILNEALLTLKNEDATQNDVDKAKARLQEALNQLERYLDPELLINTADNKNVVIIDKSSECNSDLEPNGKGTADSVLDKDESSYWHSNWQNALGATHYLSFDLGETYELENISFLPRQGARNGDILSADIYVSNDSTFEASEKVKTCTFANDGQRYTSQTLKVISFDQAVSGRYVKFVVTSCGGDQKDQYASMSEIYFYQKGEEVIVNKDALKASIEATKAIDTTNKTDDSKAALASALSAAEAVYANADATQDEVDAAKAALEEAVAGLQDKPIEPTPDPKPAMNFVDVKEGAWFYGSVESAFTKGLMSNTGKGKEYFEPDTPISRGMVATVLYRMAGLPKVEFKATFSDVTNPKLWYSTAITWASQAGVVSGYKDGSFGPDDNITRQDLAIMLRNFAKANGLDTNTKVDFSAFKDGNKVVSYAQSAVAFCIDAKLMSGAKKADGVYLNPSDKATRAECAKMFALLDDAIKANAK